MSTFCHNKDFCKNKPLLTKNIFLAKNTDPLAPYITCPLIIASYSVCKQVLSESCNIFMIIYFTGSSIYLLHYLSLSDKTFSESHISTFRIKFIFISKLLADACQIKTHCTTHNGCKSSLHESMTPQPGYKNYQLNKYIFTFVTFLTCPDNPKS